MNLAKDAERYRWLRAQVEKDNEGFVDIYIREPGEDWVCAPQIKSAAHLDAAIDSLMKELE